MLFAILREDVVDVAMLQKCDGREVISPPARCQEPLLLLLAGFWLSFALPAGGAASAGAVQLLHPADSAVTVRRKGYFIEAAY